MTDIVARLRDWPRMTPVACKEAADEIERLRAALETCRELRRGDAYMLQKLRVQR